MKLQKKGNLYEWYIKYLQNKPINPNQKYHKHHILPKHAGGLKNGPVVVCTIRDHARAHYIRYLVYGDIIDYAAYKGFVGRSDELVALINKKRITTSKAWKVLFWNPEFQYVQSKKKKTKYFLQENLDKAAEFAKLGGIVSGLIWTEKKLESSRKKGKILGKNFGRAGGLKSQGNKTKVRLQKKLKWRHWDTGKTTETINFETVADLVVHLNSIVNTLNFKNALSAVLWGTEKSRGGWYIESEEEISENEIEIKTDSEIMSRDTETIPVNQNEIKQIIKEVNDNDL